MKTSRVIFVALLLSCFLLNPHSASAAGKSPPRNGLHEEFHKNGRLASRVPYQNGERHGLATWYDNDGRLAREETYANGVLEGLVTEYYSSGGQKSKGEYRGGRKNGMHTAYAPNGKVTSQGRFDAGSPTGAHTRFYLAGGLMQEIAFENAAASMKMYFKNGSLKLEVPLIQGESHGNLKAYYASGALSSTQVYVQGKPEGVSKLYYENGSLMGTIPFRNGKPHGETKMYYASGTLKNSCTYADGILKDACRGYDPKTKQLASGKIEAAFQSGILESECTYENGRPNGLCKAYYENGTLRSEVSYVDGKPQGVAKHYFENGVLEWQATYEGGELSGPFKTYFESGGVEQEGIHAHWERQGVVTTYDESGEVLAKQLSSDGSKSITVPKSSLADPQGSGGPSASDMFGALVFIVLLFGGLLIPAFIAMARRHRDVVAIFFFSLFLGATVIGWFIALVWAFSEPKGLTHFSGRFLNEKGEEVRWRFKALHEQALRSYLDRIGWEVLQIQSAKQPSKFGKVMGGLAVAVVVAMVSIPRMMIFPVYREGIRLVKLLEQYGEQNGRYPETLDALEIPIRYSDNGLRGMRYRVQPDGSAFGLTCYVARPGTTQFRESYSSATKKWHTID